MVPPSATTTTINTVKIASSMEDRIGHSQEDQFDWQEGGWTIRTHRSKIHNNDANSLQWKSHLVWKSELGMTKFRNQDLPEALWGSNLLQIRHRGTNTSLYFCALEALRSWALLDERQATHATAPRTAPIASPLAAVHLFLSPRFDQADPTRVGAGAGSVGLHVYDALCRLDLPVGGRWLGDRRHDPTGRHVGVSGAGGEFGVGSASGRSAATASVQMCRRKNALRIRGDEHSK